MQLPPFPDLLPRRSWNGGSALVIVLAFVVLLTVIALAVFTRAMSERKVSTSSSNQMKVSALGDGAINAVLGDLHAEIVAKSTATAYGSGDTAGNLYAPISALNMVPERQSDIAATLPNLIARSASGKALYSGGATRASGESSKDPSQNGRYISPARWNSHFLLPKANLASDTDATPDAAFTPPDWILVAKDGTNPKTGSLDVVGRYAYAIYDEGGLLDLNAAGYPGQLVTDKKASQRGSLAFADLTQLTDDPSGAGGTSLLTQAQIDAIIGRRNFVSASIDHATSTETPVGGSFPDFTFSAANAENYRRFALFNSRNFLATPWNNTLSGTPSASDRLFLTRQEMISFLLNGVAKDSAADRAKLQTALQYFTHFTRDINQPSVMPASNRPKVKSGYGNDLVGLDTDEKTGINPNFLKVRRTQDVAADNSVDGSHPKKDDPVVAKRFPLSRIAWLTYKGPIADDQGNLSSDPDIKTLIDFYKKEGLTDDFLKQGGPKNILKAFGLTWGPVNPATLPKAALPNVNVWTYRGASTSVADPAMKSLNQVASLNREPDFFELLKAAVSAGALTRAATNGSIPSSVGGGDSLGPLVYQGRQDQSGARAILQLGANIIDQFDADGYPTMINASVPALSAPSQWRLISGTEDMPYIYRVRAGMVMLASANPPLPAGLLNFKANGSVVETSQDASVVNNVPALTATGVAACLLIPDVWNPNNANSPTVSPALPAPTEFRIVADGVEPDSIGGGSYNQFNMQAWKNGAQRWSDSAVGSSPSFPFSFGFNGNWLRKISSANSVIRFSSTRTLFRDPTILYMGGLPTGSNLTLPSYAVSGDLTAYCSPQSGTNGFKNVGPIDTTTHPGLTPQIPIIGIPIGVVPLRFVGSRIANTQRNLNASLWATNQGAGAHAAPNTGASSVTFRLQYLRPGATPTSSTATDWITFDVKYIDARVQTVAIPQDGVPWGPIQGYTMVNAFIDPRTPKFGAMYPWYWTPVSGSNLPPPANDRKTEWLNGGLNGEVVSDRSGETADITVTSPDFTDIKGTGFTAAAPFAKGQLGQNTSVNFYLDADGVKRAAMGATAAGTLGLPTAKSGTQMTSRPVMLNRPFRTVGELGYVFSGMPWRNIDFAYPQSGFSALLDVFCINETSDPSGMVAGRVNLNTRQKPVIKALTVGAYKNEVDPTNSADAVAEDLATNVANWLVTRTTSKPLTNVGDLVGKYVAGDGTHDGDYDGFSRDLFGNTLAGGSGAKLTGSDAAITGFGESVIRSLASVGTTRVWNLMIDLVAQTGKYPPGGAKFVVEGEQRYWVHVAVDRLTGKVIDMNTEIVKE